MIRIDSPEVQAFEKEHLATLRSLAPECMVLLKKNGDFPLSAPCKVALYGAGARETIKGGTGSGDVNVRHYVSVEEGLENAGFTVSTKPWMEGYKAAREAVIQGFYEDMVEGTISREEYLGLKADMEEHTQALSKSIAALEEEKEKALIVPARRAIIC